MPDTVTCEEHGESERTAVCIHVAESIDGKRVKGFEWLIDDEGGYQAMCKACGDTMSRLDNDAYEKFAMSVIQVLCFGCFVKAAARHGVPKADLLAARDGQT